MGPVGLVPPPTGSNTSTTHWWGQRDGELVRAMFTKAYPSFELGTAKPDAAIFEYVIGDLGAPADQIVFLDDSPLNIDGATTAGLDAVLVRGVDAARSALAERGLLHV